MCKGQSANLIVRWDFKQRHNGAETQEAVTIRLKMRFCTFRESFGQFQKDIVLDPASAPGKEKNAVNAATR